MWTEADLKAWSSGGGKISTPVIATKNLKAYEALKSGHDVECYHCGEWVGFNGAACDGNLRLCMPLRVKRFETWAVVDCSGAATYYRSKPIPSDIPPGSRLVKLGEIDE